MVNFSSYCLWKLKTQKGQLNRVVQNLCLFLLFIVVTQLPLSQPEFSAFYQKLTPFLLFSLGFIMSCLPLCAYFEEDIKDGTLDHMITNHSLYSYSLALYCSYILLYISPLVFMVGGVAFVTGFPITVTFVFMGSFWLSAFILLNWGGVAALLSSSHNQNTLLTPLMVIPLGIPSLLISHATLQAAMDNIPLSRYFFIHIGLALISVGISLGVTPYVIRRIL